MKGRTNESMWQVRLTTAPSGNQPPQEIEKNLEAPDQNIAVTRAAGMNPNMKITQATALQLDPATRAPTMIAPQNTQTALGQLPIKLGMSGPTKVGEGINPGKFQYPYSITLPASFAIMMEQTSPVPVIKRHGQYYIELQNESDMKKFLKNLISHKKDQLSRTILSGLRNTMRTV